MTTRTTTTQATPGKRKPKALTAEQVEAYLREHPDFFVAHQGLLEQLTIPHGTGVAVSLIERQVSVLREKNSHLQAQLAEIIDIARENDVLNQRLHQLTLALLGVSQPVEALRILKALLHQHFQVDYVAVRSFRASVFPELADLWLARDDAHLSHFASLLDQGLPLCGVADEATQIPFLLGQTAGDIRSFALTPLESGCFQGMLVLGSRDGERFRPGMGLNFLRVLGEIVATRLAVLWGCED